MTAKTAPPKIPRKLMDDFVRHQTGISKSVDEIGKALLRVAVAEGYEVLAKEGGVPIMVGQDSISSIARCKDDREKIGFLIVNRGGDIQFKPLPDEMLDFEKEERREEHSREIEMLSLCG
ncbi:MAG: hypothetical protein MASP_01803 [Candidatus Methanolliviera sp. GoM_asphalt]|nr:MAG: hypothetical protein MASP_01803 [Candidatus Methanolliviera sp. GoM_asphalt]